MNLAAHPDDEDGATMAYYRLARNAVVYSVIYTRGEGGQNEIGPELYEALGAIRSDETERAARRLGTQVYFLNFYDFGYSKSADETFEQWGGQDHVTERLVYLVRKLKPDVLFTNHDTVTTGPQRQHGHHQAVGLSAYDAFSLAADASYHPEHLQEPGVDLWQPRRLFVRRWRGDEGFDVAVPVGDTYEPAGMSYAALAAGALEEHASQGMSLFADWIRDMDSTYFVLLRSATGAPPHPTDLAGRLTPNRVAQPGLSYFIDAGRLPPLPPGAFAVSDSIVVPGGRIRLIWKPELLPDRRLRWEFRGAVDTTLYLTDDTPALATLRVDPDAVPTLPRAVFQYERFTNHPPIVYGLYRAGTDSLVAAGYLPVDVAPPLYVEAQERVMRLRPGINRVPFQATVYDPSARLLTLQAAVAREADKTVIFQQQAQYTLDGADHISDTLSIRLPGDLAHGSYTITLTGLARPATTAPSPWHARINAHAFDVEVPSALRVGLVESYDNTLARALQELGVSYVLLDSLDLAEGRLDSLHTILIDIRAYLTRQDLRTHNDRLLAWVRGGGHLVVHYQKTFEWNPEYPDPFDENRMNPGTFAPYPLTLGRDRVTREDAPVTVLVPDHPLLNAPNRISSKAWEGWVQERGLYFPDAYDERYESLFCMSDPGEDALCSSTLVARYGRGTYLYSALAWYRQLRVFHPGAYALFANQISLPLVDDRHRASTE